MNKYIITTQEELNKLNEEYFELSSNNRNLKWSGCNYYKNKGNNKYEPLGTAQSMHDCNNCEKFNCCKVKMDTPIWFWNQEIEKEIKNKWKSMFKGG